MRSNRIWRAAGLCVVSISVLASIPRSFAIGQTKGKPTPEELEAVEVEGQPLASNVQRVIQAMEFLGAPLPIETTNALQSATRARDGRRIQQLLDGQVLLFVKLNPEARVKVTRGRAPAVLQQ